MAMMYQPLDLKTVLAETVTEIGKIKRKTTTLIDYYIYPEPTPSAISAYEPRLTILESRTKTLAKISFPHLKQLIDHAEATGGSYLGDIIEQLLNAVHGVREVFKEHYDRALAERKPYEAIYMLLEFREKQLKDFVRDQMTNPYFVRPEAVPPTEGTYFCRGAVQMINSRDSGRARPLRERELTEANASTVKQFGGGYLWWECAACKYRVKFHMVASNNLSIHTVEEIREHMGMPIEYRSAFLAKSHLFAPTLSTSDERDRERERNRRRRSSFAFASGSSSSSNTYYLSEGPKYGCVFCFSEGKKLVVGNNNATSNGVKTTFDTAQDLAQHLVQKHSSPYPPSLLLQKFGVAVKGKCAEGVRRWDVNFR